MVKIKFIKLVSPFTFQNKEGEEYAYVSSNDVLKYTEKNLAKIIKNLFKKQDKILAISVLDQRDLEKIVNSNSLENGEVKIVNGIKILGRYTNDEKDLKDLFVVCYNNELYEISDAPPGYNEPLVEISKIVSPKIIEDFKKTKLKEKYTATELAGDGVVFAPVAFIPKKIYQEKFNGIPYSK